MPYPCSSCALVQCGPLLSNPVPHPLDDVPWLVLRPDLSVERGLAGPDVCLAGLDEGRALDDLPDQVQEEVNRDDDVAARIMSVQVLCNG